MDWDKLRIFHAVAQAGSFTHAGETLNLSQSAVSRQISALEDTLGLSLFHRHARGLILTEEGEILSETAKEIFGKLAMIEGQLADSRQRPEGPLRITAAEFIGSTWLAPNMAGLREKNPGIQITLILDDRILNLSMREADAAIRLYRPEQPDLIQRHLADIHFDICASRSYLKKHKAPETAKDLKSHALIGYPEDMAAPYADANWLLHLADIDPEDGPAGQNLMLINSLHGMHMAVLGGAGIAALPRYMTNGNKEIVILLPNAPRPKVEMYFVYPEERRHSQRLSTFRDSLVQMTAETHF